MAAFRSVGDGGTVICGGGTEIPDDCDGGDMIGSKAGVVVGCDTEVV